MERIALVELNVSNVKMTIADIGNNYFVEVAKFSESLKTGYEDFGDHFFKKSQIEEVVRVLKNFKKLSDRFKVAKTIANAMYNALSKPKNIYSFFDEIFATTGFRFALVSEDDALTNLYLGVINTLDEPKAVVCEIMPESVNILQYNRRNIVGQGNLSICPLQLIEDFSASDYENSKDRIMAIEKKIKSDIKKQSWLSTLDEEVNFIGSGSFFEDICNMVKKLNKYPLNLTHAYVVNIKDIETLYEQMKNMELDKTKVIKGASQGRADVFFVSIAIVLSVMKTIQKKELVISSCGEPQGVLLCNASPLCVEKPISDCLGYSITGQMQYYDSEFQKHNEQIYNLAMLLYRQLKVLHKLPRGYIKVLRAASMLHDCGKRVNPVDHAKHSFYVLLSSEIYGLTHREKLLAAYVASLHEGGEISIADWTSKKDIVTEEDFAAVKKLGIILRLAECLDSTGTNAIIDMNCDVLGDSVIMKTFTESDNSFEISEAQKIGKEFEKNFNKRIEIL